MKPMFLNRVVVMLAAIAPWRWVAAACSVLIGLGSGGRGASAGDPPDLDTPSTSGALVVPGGGAGPSEAARPTAARSSGGTGIDGLHVEDAVSSTWSRVGTALERAAIGSIDARDESSHTYTLSMTVTHSSDEGAAGSSGW